MKLLREVYKDLSELIEELFEECMKGMKEKNEYIYKEVSLKEKVEFDDDEEDWTAV
tara:strand:- start:384 stop:551 length:168 start_codon:yes stop_codon:yes gene_type:complete